jgi:hypothetical protein
MGLVLTVCLTGRATVDPIVLAAGTALIGAIATDGWQQAREAVVRLWSRVHPRKKAEAVGGELEKARGQVLQARLVGDTEAEKALETAWQAKLQQLLLADPALGAELQLILDQVLTPVLTPAEQGRVGKIIMTGSSHGSSTFTQIGIQTHYHRP